MIRIIIVLMLSLVVAPSASAQDMQIAAIVGDEAISDYDVKSRIRFVIASTNLPNTPEVIGRIAPQVIRTLIDEKLQLQEAKRAGIEISDGEIGPAVAEMETAQKLEAGTLFLQLENADIPVNTFAEQIRAQIAWSKLLQKAARPRINIEDDEVEQLFKRSMAPTLNQEWQVGVLNLDIDTPQQAAEIQKLAKDLIEEVNKGANFEEVARQFSTNDIARFWIKPQQLDPVLMKVLLTVKPGELTPPVPAQDRVTIVKLYNVRHIEADKKVKTPTMSEQEYDRIRNFLFRQAMARESQKYLRNLRRKTYIEMR